MFEKFLAAGMAVAGVDVGESYGSPKGRAGFTALYQELTGKRGLAKKACLLARSRGGLMLYNWACENTGSVACVAGIYPVCNLRSYPGLAKACGAYGLTEAELQAQLAQHNPIERLAPLAQAGVPIFHIHGDSDTLVPLKDNSEKVATCYRELGGAMQLVVPPGQGHNMWQGFFQCKELVDFVIANKQGARTVTDSIMQAVYDEVKTPFKYGIVVRPEPGKKADCPGVFRHNDAWYMTYIVFDGAGYETALAESADLVTWKPLGKILSFRQGTWDAQQAGGYVALQDYAWGGTAQLQPYDGKYWLSYLGGALKGYETDPLAIGIAWTTDPDKPVAWTRLDQPVLTRDQPDCRDFEKLTQYKSNIIWDKEERLGYPFVMYYNGKKVSGYERIGMAVSKDMKTWLRYGREPVVDNGKGISGDPQIVKIGDVWVMFYFGAFWKPGAFDTFACSYDLSHWTKWSGPHLVEPSEPWDKQYAHKPWMIKHNGVVYHFYCATGDQGRVIALATSRDMRK